MYKINIESFADVFAVPKQITDKHLKLAGSTQLKVLLYAFRHPEKEINTEELSSILGISNGDICDALQYWIECGFITENGNIHAPKTTEPETEIIEIPLNTEYKEQSVPAKEEIHIFKPTREQIAARISESQEIRTLFFELERILNKTVGFDTQSTVLYLTDYAGLPPEVIIMLCQYLVSNGHTGIREIERTGLSWAEKEINTFEKANKQIERLEKTTAEWRQLKVLMGLDNEKPTASQKNYLDIWINEFKFSTDVIFYAYEKTVEKTGKINFKYMNTMLASWNGLDLKSVDEIEKYNEEFKSKIQDTKEKTGLKQKKPVKSETTPPSYDINKAFGDFSIPKKTKR